jgi:hypothetical protein
MSDLQWIIDMRNGLPSNDLILMWWDFRNEMKDMLRLLQEEPEIKSDFER